MAFWTRTRPTSEPADELDAALAAERVTAAQVGFNEDDLRSNWADLKAECGVPARDFLRCLLHRPYTFDPRVLDEAAKMVTLRRGGTPPGWQWTDEQVHSLASQIKAAVASGASQKTVLTLLNMMPDHPLNTACFIAEMLKPLGHADHDLGPLLNASATSEPVTKLATVLIDLAGQDRWDDIGPLLLAACEPDLYPALAGETGQALEGLLAGLLYREFTPNGP